MYLMETALGQFSQSSPLTVWRLAPIGRGIGFAMVTISLIVAIYYNILMGNILVPCRRSFEDLQMHIGLVLLTITTT